MYEKNPRGISIKGSGKILDEAVLEYFWANSR